MTRTLAAALACLAGAASADPLEGLWRTAPDANDNWALIEVASCGPAADVPLCGRVIRAYDVTGDRVASPTVGRRVLTAATPAGGGEYAALLASDDGASLPVRLVLAGDAVTVWDCSAPSCRFGGTWDRVR